MSLQPFQAVNPIDGLAFGAEYPDQSQAEVVSAIARAAGTRNSFAALALSERANLLEAIAAEVENLRSPLVTLANLETGLPEARKTFRRHWKNMILPRIITAIIGIPLVILA